MSSTARGAQRNPDDFYETPAWATRAELATMPFIGEAPRILEPMAGRGAIVRELRARWPNSHITAIELDAERAASLKDSGASEVICGDFFDVASTIGGFDLAFTNPAFSIAMDVINSLERVAVRRELLLRLNFLGSQERAPFWRSNPADLGILPKRPSFAASLKCGGVVVEKGARGAKALRKKCDFRLTLMLDATRPEVCPTCGGKVDVTLTDSCEYSWFAWGPGLGGRHRILDITEAA